VHEWWGNNAYSQKRAKMLAELGYTAFAADTMNISTTYLTKLLGRKPTTVQEYLLSKFKK